MKRIAITLGDPRGIGPEIVRDVLETPPPGAEFVVVGPDQLDPSAAGHPFAGVGPWDPEDDAATAGRVAHDAIKHAAEMAMRGEIDGVVTAPIDKDAMMSGGVPHPGHTELLGALTNCNVAMMLAVDQLRVVLVTTHIPLATVPSALSTQLVVEKGRITLDALRGRFGIADPRLAVCALNPHAGESGRFGTEDREVLAPAAAELDAVGPVPADTVFVRAAKGEFDAVLAPYHDVGMTAVKVAGFGRAVNITLGLPFVRTSPDHGTAMGIVGTGQADSSSMRKAVELAIELS